MKTVNSLSGGGTSAYMEAEYPADYSIFALVRVRDPKCKLPDKKMRSQIEDRIQKPFIGTVEDNTIIHTMLDLEQFTGRKIHWVAGDYFEDIIQDKGRRLPNKLQRFCTTHLKIEPMFNWWHRTIGEPVEMRIGFRANEMSRAKRMNARLNDQGLLEYRATFSKHPVGSNHAGKNLWELIPWQKPVYPLISDGIFKDTVVNYWKDKPVRFAPLNNCVGCFHKTPLLLRKMYDEHPEKLAWFESQEGVKNSRWRSDITYAQIRDYQPKQEVLFSEFSECDSGQCGI